jgi:hypothetical protein
VGLDATQRCDRVRPRERLGL